MIHRLIKLPKQDSFFLFGPRGTGKSTLLKHLFQSPQTIYIDLLEPKEEDRFRRHPEELKHLVAAADKEKPWVVIDEIQKVPRLLDVVHSLIESTDFRFALTGSSARKLKRGSGNLLAGRAAVFSLFPFTHLELQPTLDLQEALEWGTLPKVLATTDVDRKRDFLSAYCLTYLKEEIQVEQVVRRLDPFRHFLEVAAQCNGQILNFSKIARDIGTDTKTVQSYFEILEDTLIGVLLQPYHRSIRKRQRVNPKFYFFDLGVKRALEQALTVKLLPHTTDFGNAFEHFVILEALRLNSYFRKDFRFSYLRTQEDAEIDLIIERPGKPIALVEIKSTDHIHETDVTTLAKFHGDFSKAEGFCLSRDPHPKNMGQIVCRPWDLGLKQIGFIP